MSESNVIPPCSRHEDLAEITLIIEEVLSFINRHLQKVIDLTDRLKYLYECGKERLLVSDDLRTMIKIIELILSQLDRLRDITSMQRHFLFHASRCICVCAYLFNSPMRTQVKESNSALCKALYKLESRIEYMVITFRPIYKDFHLFIDMVDTLRLPNHDYLYRNEYVINQKFTGFISDLGKIGQYKDLIADNQDACTYNRLPRITPVRRVRRKNIKRVRVTPY